MPRTQSGLIAPPPSVASAVRRHYAREGLARTCQLLRVSRATVDRLRGGVPVHVGTLMIVREALVPIDPAVNS